MTRFNLRKRYVIISAVMIITFVVGLVVQGPRIFAQPVQPHFNHFLATHAGDDGAYDDNQPSVSAALAQQRYDDQAYPRTSIGFDQTMGAYNAFQSVSRHPSVWGARQSWHLVGPTTGNVAVQTTYTGRATTASGRVTALLVSKFCNQSFCPVWLGAAGGGIWVTLNGLATQPKWISASYGLGSNAIGSIAMDPNDRLGRTLYVGTGEQNGSSDSEAGVGLYKSTDFGFTWHSVRGSVAVAQNRAIGSIAVDPQNSRHIFIGTSVARHGASSVNGGRFTPPGAPQIGLYESTDGGATFNLVFSKASDSVNPGSPNGSDFFRGGISNIAFDHANLYFSVFDYGLYRQVSDGTFEQVFASAGGGTVANSAGSRTEFALAPNGNKLRIYVTDTDGTNPADFYRVDDANVPAATLTNGTTNPGWLKLSNSVKGTPGFSSYNFCETQCSYDMFVASPAGHPDTVWIGGSMAYDEIFTATPPSNGRAVQRSSNAGTSFTDMTNDAQTPPLGMHPDQHAIALAPNNPDIAFTGSDGGIVRTSGQFADTSADCDKRGISGADLADCKLWLKAVPTQLYSLNAGLSTLQFQSVSVNPQAPTADVIGGTQDNGTWSFNGTADNGTSSLENVGGDGGQSGIDTATPNIRFHTYFGPNGDVNFKGNDPTGWDLVTQPLSNSKEQASFYIPLATDPAVGGTVFAGLEHVWRTQDDGGAQADLDKHCNEITGDGVGTCGDWVALGGPTLTGTSFGADKGGSYVVAVNRAASDKSTLWAATRLGRLFISKNADAPAASVTFNRIDTAAQPGRFISGIAVDPKNPNHAFVTFSGYNAYTPATTGHVFDVTYDPAAGKATWKDISYDLGDAPITSVAYDDQLGDLYISSDFGVGVLRAGRFHWAPAAPGLPMVAVYGLTISTSGRVLYAATHGRSAWRLDLKQ